MVVQWFQRGEIDSQIHRTADAEQLRCGADKAKSEGEARCYSSTVSGASCGHLVGMTDRRSGEVFRACSSKRRPPRQT